MNCLFLPWDCTVSESMEWYASDEKCKKALRSGGMYEEGYFELWE